jgi:hypothetical protein
MLKVNGDSKSSNERAHSLVGSLSLSCRYKRFVFSLGCSPSRPGTKYFFISVNFFTSFVPIAQQAGLAVVLGRLSLCMCLLLRLERKVSENRRGEVREVRDKEFKVW